MKAWWLSFFFLAACGPSKTSETSPDGGNGEADGGSPPAFTQCSGDLHHILDDVGGIVQTCPLNQGCSEGKCIPACEAAAKSGGNLGCEFYAATPHFHTSTAPPCFAAFVANGWGEESQISVSRAGTDYDTASLGRIAATGAESNWAAIPETGVPTDEVGVLFLSHDPAARSSMTCPVTLAISNAGGTAADTTRSVNAASFKGTAWKITTTRPVSAYDILPYGGADTFLPSAQLLNPSASWGTNFVGVLPIPGWGQGNHWMQVLAREDNTTVTLQAKGVLPGGAYPAVAANVPQVISLNAGEFAQWQFNDGIDNSGSVIDSDKPISFIGGHTYTCYRSATSTSGGCDSSHQYVPPVNALGTQYVGAPHISRHGISESIVYRMVGVVDGTTLTFSPAIPGAPTELAKGQVVDFEATSPFVVNSQDDDHPFYSAQTMAGCILTGGGPCLGDEDYVVMLPPKQFLKRYVFFTDPSYPTTSLAVTRVADESGNFSDVTIDCLGAVSGWQTVDSKHEVAEVRLVEGGVGQGSCENGAQLAESALPFGITVWGLDSASSYGYPAGGNTSTINDVVVVID